MAGAKTPKNPDEAALRTLGLSFPETTEDFPWGHRTLKVRGKAFVFMGTGEEAGGERDRFFISCKLPQSAPMALTLPGVKPTGYGLGRAGWVSAEFAQGAAPRDMLAAWLRESYCAVAPKKLAAMIAPSGAVVVGRAPSSKLAAAKANERSRKAAKAPNAKQPAAKAARSPKARVR